jgi:LPXTG-motif cell wall-anchored protein
MNSVSKSRKGEHTMNVKTRWMQAWLVLAVGAICLALVLSTSAQVKTETTTTSGHAAKVTNVEHGEVLSVQGNDLLIKMENGEIRHFPNVPESARVTVDGKQLGIHDLQPGMKLERTITTTTTPQTITTVQSVTGTVWHVTPPLSVILTLENGQNQQFKIPKGQKFMVEGQETDAWGLKKGMKVSATKVVEVPATAVEQQKQVTGTAPPPPPAPPANVPILIAAAAPTATPEAPAELPKTGSFVPLLGMLGLLSLGTSFGLRILRKQ